MFGIDPSQYPFVVIGFLLVLVIALALPRKRKPYRSEIFRTKYIAQPTEFIVEEERTSGK